MKIITKTKKKKVLHIGQDTGGVKTYMTQVFEFCDVKIYEFLVIAPANELFEEYCKQRYIRYYPINLLRGGGPFSIISALLSIIKILIKEKPDLIHAHSAKGGFLGRLAGKITGSKNVIYTPHAFSYLSFTGIKRMIFYGLETLAKTWATVLLAISYSEADKAIYELGYNKRIVKIIPNSVQIPVINIKRKACKIINIRMIGRLTIQKNPLLFLEIARCICHKYENVRFAILGAGIHDDLAEEIKSFITNNDLQEKVEILGWVDSSRSKLFLQESDIFLMTSIFEGLPYSLLEAMALGKPCIVSNVEGNKDVIRNGENGFTCINKDDFCDKIELLLLNEDVRDRIGTAGFEYVKVHHNILTNIILLEKLYKEITPSLEESKFYLDNIIPLRTED